MYESENSVKYGERGRREGGGGVSELTGAYFVYFDSNDVNVSKFAYT